MIGQEEFCDFKQHFSGREDLFLNGVCSQRRGISGVKIWTGKIVGTGGNVDRE